MATVIDISYGYSLREYKRQQGEREARIARGANHMHCKGGGPLSGLGISLDIRSIDIWYDAQDEDELFVQYLPPLPTEDESRAHLELVRTGQRRFLGRYLPNYIRGGFFWKAHKAPNTDTAAGGA